MPAVKRRYYIFIAVLVLILSGLAARVHLAEILITAPLQQAGLTDVTADIQRLSLDKTRLSQLGFVISTDAGQLTLNARDITINYLPGKLIKGRIDTLEVSQIALRHHPYSQAVVKNTGAKITHRKQQPAEILAMLRAALAKHIPLNKLSVQNITLDGEIFAGLDGKSLQLVSTNNADVLYVELTMLSAGGENSSQNAATAYSQLLITTLSKDELNIELRPALAPDKQPASIKLRLDETNVSGSYQFSPRGLISWLQPASGLEAINGIDTISGELSLIFDANDDLHGAVTASSKHLSITTYDAENIALDITFNYTTGKTSQNLKLLEGSHLKADNVSIGGISFRENRIDLSGEVYLTENDWKYQGMLNSKRLTAAYASQKTELSNITSIITADSASLQAEGSFSPASLPARFTFMLSHKLDHGAGTLSLSPLTAIDLSTEEDTISKLLIPWPYAFDLYHGKLSLSAQASWSEEEAFKLAGEISLEDIGGNIGEIVFSGLSFYHELDILPATRSEKASQLAIATVDSGVTISDISMSLAATTSKRGPLPRFIVRQSVGKILGGSFSADDMIYDLNRDKNSFRINLKDIELAEIVKTQQLENIAASGRLNGSLPVEIDKQNIVIAHGGLVNNKAGTIRYTPEAGTGQLRQNPLTGITLDALRDFRYSDLEADVNYQPDGELTINLELKGISPGLDENRPVHLNINTEQNLISLLNSLRFAQGVSDSIDAKVRRIYEQSHK
jgi:Dicarboxylate transport